MAQQIDQVFAPATRVKRRSAQSGAGSSSSEGASAAKKQARQPYDEPHCERAKNMLSVIGARVEKRFQSLEQWADAQQAEVARLGEGIT